MAIVNLCKKIFFGGKGIYDHKRATKSAQENFVVNTEGPVMKLYWRSDYGNFRGNMIECRE